ncbi:MAG: peptidase M20, partial [Betaproteobacteria bacterium]|nr:peptidase M20 [Betaproteobacteria bacterium]
MNARVPPSALNAAQALTQVSRAWDEQIVPQLTDYIGIPAKSPMFDADWAKHGYIDTVMRNTAAWVEAQKVEGLTLEIIRTEGRTPLMFFEVAASSGAAGGPAAVSQQTVL